MEGTKYYMQVKVYLSNSAACNYLHCNYTSYIYIATCWKMSFFMCSNKVDVVIF